MDLEAFLDLDVFVHLFILVVAIIVARGWYRAWREKWPKAPLGHDHTMFRHGVNPVSGAPMAGEGVDGYGNPRGFDDIGDRYRHNDDS